MKKNSVESSKHITLSLCIYLCIDRMLRVRSADGGKHHKRVQCAQRERGEGDRQADNQADRRTDRDCMLSFRPFMFFRDIFGTILYQHKNPWFSIFTMASETQLLRRLYCMSIAFINLGNHQFIMFHHWVSISVLHIWYVGAESTFIGFSQQKNL